MTSQLFHHLLCTNDAETEPGDGGDYNSIHTGGCLIDGAVNGGDGIKVLSLKWYTSGEKLYMILRAHLN